MDDSSVEDQPLCTPCPALDLVTQIYKDLYNEPYKYFDANEQPIGTRGQMTFVRQLVKAVAEQTPPPESRYTTVPGWKPNQDARIAEHSSSPSSSSRPDTDRLLREKHHITAADIDAKNAHDSDSLRNSVSAAAAEKGKMSSLIHAMKNLKPTSGWSLGVTGGSRVGTTTKRKKSHTKTRNKSRTKSRTKSRSKPSNRRRNKTRSKLSNRRRNKTRSKLSNRRRNKTRSKLSNRRRNKTRR
jgi:hypothetical protein